MQPRPRTPSESARAVRVMPAESIGTRNAVMPWPRSPGRVRANTIATDGVLGVGDPDFLAGDAIAAARLDRLGLLVRRVGAGVRLGEREGADRLAARQLSQPALALRIASGVRDHFGHQRVGHRQRHRDGRAGPRDRFDRQRVADVVPAEAAPGLRDRDAEQPLPRRRVHHVGGKLARLVDAGRALRDDLARELLDLLLEGFLFGCEF